MEFIWSNPHDGYRNGYRITITGLFLLDPMRAKLWPIRFESWLPWLSQKFDDSNSHVFGCLKKWFNTINLVKTNAVKWLFRCAHSSPEGSAVAGWGHQPGMRPFLGMVSSSHNGKDVIIYCNFSPYRSTCSCPIVLCNYQTGCLK